MDQEPDTLASWIERHPGTMLYVAIMVTASVILQAVLVFR
jgi:hypothetical protein